MNLVLEKIHSNSTMGKTASVDLFDSRGILLLTKGQVITEKIRESIERREVYILKNRRDLMPPSKRVKAFPKDVYIKLVGSLWSIYHEAKLIGDEQIKKTVVLVEMILREIQTSKVYLDIDAIRLDFATFKQYDYGTFVHVLNVALLATITGMFDRGGSYISQETYVDLLLDLTRFIERVEFKEAG